jgi:hypothetical protein
MFRYAALSTGALSLVLAGLSALNAAEEAPDCLSTVERAWYRLLKPTSRDVLWRQIPWMQDLDKAVKQAKKEKRPLFIWATDDEPLERC